MDIKNIQNAAICAIVAFGLSRVVVKFLDTMKSVHSINATNSVVLISGRDISITDTGMKGCTTNEEARAD